MPFICQIRDDIPEGVLQILDLVPNTSQRNYVIDPPGQTKYLRRPDNDTVATSAPGAIITVAEYKGVAAWLIDHVEDAPNGDALTAAQANTIAGDLITAMDASSALTLTDVNAIIAAVVTGSGLAGTGNSTGTLFDLLKVLSGAEYVLPKGSIVDTDGSTYNTTTLGSFTEGQYRTTYDSFALNISVGEGQLSGYLSSTFEYGGVSGAAVVVYEDDGSKL